MNKYDFVDWYQDGDEARFLFADSDSDCNGLVVWVSLNWYADSVLKHDRSTLRDYEETEMVCEYDVLDYKHIDEFDQELPEQVRILPSEWADIHNDISGRVASLNF